MSATAQIRGEEIWEQLCLHGFHSSGIWLKQELHHLKNLNFKQGCKANSPITWNSGCCLHAWVAAALVVLHVNEHGRRYQRCSLPFPHFSSYYTPKHDSYYDNQGLFFSLSYFKSALCSEEDVQFWKGQLGFHCIYKWADQKHVSHQQSDYMMGWIWRMMAAPGIDTQV